MIGVGLEPCETLIRDLVVARADGRKHRADPNAHVAGGLIMRIARQPCQCPGDWKPPWRRADAILSASAAAMRSKTMSQPPRPDWRKRQAVGYQGLSSRPISQRQSGADESAIQTGIPSAPAR